MTMSTDTSQMSNQIKTILETVTSLQLATLSLQNRPFSSYAPYALGENCFYLLVSELSPHTHHLHNHPIGCVMIVQQESESNNPYLRPRVQYDVTAEFIEQDSEEWTTGIQLLTDRFGETVTTLVAQKDFYLVRLDPEKVNFIRQFKNDYVIDDTVLY
ncbi:Pyridoxamine 5'-phosphate oxidase [Marinomonas spartinae]|uniref:HugZ family pyridoxamine 5'-phosphate oxidase n=1 Tax=Marinomonas spartinae TaxID=1792290 RepID=UPI000808AD97|nr:pyridoxamine 5'-phosphate oxidase family protein [Marinomonas spartinae]SBS33018.1 Pyridoxamine 5'-phosphate oxidase [Marinomonas spartinae]